MHRAVGKYRRISRVTATVAAVLPLLVALACTTGSGAGTDTHPQPHSTTSVSAPHVCDSMPPGPASAPQGAVVVAPAVAGDLIAKTEANPPGTTFWLRPGRHTLGGGRYDKVMPKTGDTYIGAPGAVLDGRGVNQYAFSGHAHDVTISHLTIQGFPAPHDEGVVNHASADGWVIEANTIQNNSGAAMMAGARQQVRGNCLRDNGQYGINAYQPGDGITDLVVTGNEIVGNNTDDWETRIPGCGCSGGAKFWAVNGAVIRDNWIHDNHGPGLWADTNNNDFVIEGNLIEGNDGEAIIYEISYNAIIRDNVIRGNTLVAGRKAAKDGDNFPIAAIYISESGGEPRVPARTDRIEIYGNVLTNNWSGITLWEGANRFCNSPTNPTDDCTLLVKDPQRCVQPGIASPPLYDDCRWKTQRVDIHDNRFVFDPDKLDCSTMYCGRMAILSNYGTYPDWSPYKGNVISEAVTFEQHNRWHDNTYVGPWSFVAHDASRALDRHQWQTAPYNQDAGSSFARGEGHR